jgi:hypothetical protein
MAEGTASRDHPTPEALTALLTPGQRLEAGRRLASLQHGSSWHGGLPVLLLERCWLRLSCVPVEKLALRLPPDASREAPELERYRQLLAIGHPGWQAQQICWEEFGAQACREALVRYWSAQERGRQGWTLQHYLDLLRVYRRSFEWQQPRPLPLLVLARVGEAHRSEAHRLIWLRPDVSEPSHPMRHTCA